MYALDTMTETGVWRTLKRTLNHGKLEIQPIDMFFPFSTAALKPEPIDVHAKVILIGDREMYELLYDYEDDFKKIFKVRVEFDEEMKWSDEVFRHYGGRLRKLVDDEKLLHFDRTAVAAILEHGVRMAGRRGKITTRFFDLADLARESCYAARHDGSSVVTAGHVREALDAKIDRHNLLETKIREMIEQNLVFIDTTGGRVGQVNGLSVMEIGGYAFGKPVRITASVALGKTGIINIERESNLSGRFHDKGVQIISGYMRRTFAQDKPLSLSASVCFEQSYSGVDGDSASSTEIYALLSALSELAHPAGARRHRLGEPAGRRAAHRRREPENRRILRRLPPEGTHRQAGRADSRGKRGRPDAARRSDRSRRAGPIPHLPGRRPSSRESKSSPACAPANAAPAANSSRAASSRRWTRGCIRWHPRLASFE